MLIHFSIQRDCREIFGIFKVDKLVILKIIYHNMMIGCQAIVCMAILRLCAVEQVSIVMVGSSSGAAANCTRNIPVVALLQTQQNSCPAQPGSLTCLTTHTHLTGLLLTGSSCCCFAFEQAAATERYVSDFTAINVTMTVDRWKISISYLFSSSSVCIKRVMCPILEKTVVRFRMFDLRVASDVRKSKQPYDLVSTILKMILFRTPSVTSLIQVVRVYKFSV